jgi:hypothetical protein
LPAPQAASQTTAAAGAANSSQGSQSVLSQTVVVDRAANTVVYQTINQQTGQVLNQFPDDAVLQARAYFRALDEAQLEKSQGLLDQTA